jgi:hypothetical protein
MSDILNFSGSNFYPFPSYWLNYYRLGTLINLIPESHVQRTRMNSKQKEGDGGESGRKNPFLPTRRFHQADLGNGHSYMLHNTKITATN